MMMITVSTVYKDTTPIQWKWLRIDHINLHIELDHDHNQLIIIKGQCMMMVIFNHITDFTLNEVTHNQSEYIVEVPSKSTAACSHSH